MRNRGQRQAIPPPPEQSFDSASAAAPRRSSDHRPHRFRLSETEGVKPHTQGESPPSLNQWTPSNPEWATHQPLRPLPRKQQSRVCARFARQPSRRKSPPPPARGAKRVTMRIAGLKTAAARSTVVSKSRPRKAAPASKSRSPIGVRKPNLAPCAT